MFRTESINQPGSHRSVILGAVLVLAFALAIVAIAGFGLMKGAVRPGAGGAAVPNPATTSESQRETWRGVYVGAAVPNPATTSESQRETWRGVYVGGGQPVVGPQPGDTGNDEFANPLHRFNHPQPR
jgi:hypothetical protein